MHCGGYGTEPYSSDFVSTWSDVWTRLTAHVKLTHIEVWRYCIIVLLHISSRTVKTEIHSQCIMENIYIGGNLNLQTALAKYSKKLNQDERKLFLLHFEKVFRCYPGRNQRNFSSVQGIEHKLVLKLSI